MNESKSRKDRIAELEAANKAMADHISDAIGLLQMGNDEDAFTVLTEALYDEDADGASQPDPVAGFAALLEV